MTTPAADARAADTQMRRSADSKRGFFTVRTAGALFGLPVDAVQTIFRLQSITPVPLGPPVIAGLVNLRGKIVTAVSLARRLGLDSDARDASALAVAVERRGETFALIVEAVGDAIECGPADLIPSPRHIVDERARLTSSYYRTEKGILPVLDVDALFDAPREAAPEPKPNYQTASALTGAIP